MKKLLLIGGGTIATHYKQGLRLSPNYELVALADINPRCAAREVFDVPFYTDYNAALSSGAEVALISTSTGAHYDIARSLLNSGIAVITEKPMCDSYDKVEALCSLAKRKKIDLGCVFHWIYADEVRFLKQHLADFGSIRRITVRICDDYANTSTGTIDTTRRGLAGAWLDSGINAFSYVGELIDLRNYKLQLMEEEIDSVSSQAKYARRVFTFGEVSVDIAIDWRTASRSKTAEIECDNGLVQVNHTEQRVLFNGKVVYDNPVPDRLSAHYLNAFAEFTLNKQQLQRTLLLHKILFERSK